MYTKKESYETAWLKAERDLAISGYVLHPDSSTTPCSTDEINPKLDEDILEHVQPDTAPTKLENYTPGASREEIFNALKKVAKTSKSKPSKNG